jgi:acyl-CoA synthetase (AMP-forming)/AMP-acid ligase II
VRGANVTAGYWQRPETNAETIVDGWLRTGDIVRADDAGRVHIVDRIKDIIIRGGENVSSIEVESALLAAPGVAEAAVIAVPDDVMGEKVGAVLFGGAETVDVPQVLAHCRKQLADFKIPSTSWWPAGRCHATPAVSSSRHNCARVLSGVPRCDDKRHGTGERGVPREQPGRRRL